jgi:hypothetical protein
MASTEASLNTGNLEVTRAGPVVGFVMPARHARELGLDTEGGRVARVFERKATDKGLTLKLYRGEGVALLAFDIEAEAISDEFVGFSLEVKYPGAKRFGALRNRLHFDRPPYLERPRSFCVDGSPVSEVPLDSRAHRGGRRRVPLPRHRQVHERCRQAAHPGQRRKRRSLNPRTIDGFLNIGFTRLRLLAGLRRPF